MALNSRYLPSHPQGQTCIYGLDFSAILPPGVGINSGSLSIARNTVPPTSAGGDFSIGPVTIGARRLYAELAGGIEGTDYMLLWVAFDSLGNVWQRSALLLCAQTS